MSVFAEFRVPADAFVFDEAFAAEPELVVEIERVVAADNGYLTPYFWVSGVSEEAFEVVARSEGSVAGLRRLDQFEASTLYRADWREDVNALVYAYTNVGASILEAKGHAEEWLLRMRFDSRENIDGFIERLNDTGVSFRLQRLHEIEHPRTGEQFGLSPKQTEALVTAWEMGYFDLPREASMEEVAGAIGIAPQSFSDWLRRAQYTLIGNAMRVTTATEPTADGAARTSNTDR